MFQWGVPSATYTMPTLRQSNLTSMTQDIPLASLTLTFRDAIRAAHRLGLQYIWIDSLCIIQDSAADWARESVTMCDIYNGSTINLAAAASDSGAGGCFRARDAAHVRPCGIRVLRRVVEADNRESDQHDYDCWEPMWDRAWDAQVDQAPLYARAWVQQERLLAPRTLNFGATQLLWECNDRAAWEGNPEGHQSGLMKTKLHNTVLGAKLWPDVVRRYCATSLTFQSDKLVALSGIAKFLHQMYPAAYDEYHAGMWRRDVERQMFWTAGVRDASGLGPLKGTLRPRPEGNTVPTWSWASTEGPVFMRELGKMGRVRMAFRVVDVRVEPRGEDVFGQVTRGTMTVAGLPLKTARLTFRDDEAAREGKYELDGIPFPSGLLHLDVHLPPRYNGTTVYLLPAICTSFSKSWPGQDKETNCFVLAETQKNKGEYERLGLLLYSFEFPRCVELQAAPGRMEEELYLRVDGGDDDPNFAHVITIV